MEIDLVTLVSGMSLEVLSTYAAKTLLIIILAVSEEAQPE